MKIVRRGCLLVASCLLLSCSRAPGVDADWSRNLATAHAEIDVLLDEGDGARAKQALERMLGTLQAQSASGFPAGRDAMKDAYYRLARLSLDQKDLARALETCQQGLALGVHEDLFTANLLVLRGTIREEQGRAADAVEDFHDALLINESLLTRAVPQ